MGTTTRWFSRATEFVAAILMAAMFATFIIQITIRYTARLSWVAEAVPFLAPDRYGWTLEFCLLMWVWIVFWGNAFIVRQRDHVTFDILYTHVAPNVRKWFAIISGLAVCVALVASIEPTWSRFAILRLKSTATLDQVFGPDLKMRGIYSIYIAFLVIVALRYGWRAINAYRNGAEADLHHYAEIAEETDEEFQTADPK
ncbi:TRAP transporter small permease [Tropicimonas aquimaris]|uniref:TRAP transporter small permease protein n=1 Tax=Tropicimonas aquimaris TaxID=914152 RepID=A0ABW3IUM7_9RHOB